MYPQVSWLPYTVVCFIKMFGLPVSQTMSALPLLFAKSSICWNPIIYVMFNDQVIFNV
jgi:c-opsin